MLMVTPRRLAMAGRDANELINVYCLVLGDGGGGGGGGKHLKMPWL